MNMPRLLSIALATLRTNFLGPRLSGARSGYTTRKNVGRAAMSNGVFGMPPLIVQYKFCLALCVPAPNTRENFPFGLHRPQLSLERHLKVCIDVEKILTSNKVPGVHARGT